MSYAVRSLKRISEAWYGGSDFFMMVYTIYTLGGIWVLRRKHIEKRPNILVAHKVVEVVAFIVCLISFFSYLYETYLVRSDIEKLFYNLGAAIFFVTTMFRFILLTYRKDEFEALMVSVNQNLYLEHVGKCAQDKNDLNVGQRHLKQITMFIYFLLVSGMTFKVLAHSLTEHSLPIPFPYVADIPSPFYEIIFVGETIGSTHFLAIAILQQITIVALFVKVLSHYTILVRNLVEIDKLFPGRDIGGGVLMGETHVKELWREYELKCRQEMIFAMLKRNIIHHQKILQTIERMSVSLNEVFFIQIFGGGLLIVDLFFHAYMKRNSVYMTLSQCTYSLAAILDITFVTYYGSEIEKKSHAAGTCLYGTNWLEMDVRNRFTLSFFQQVLYKHPIIKAGKLFSINLTMYLKFLNSIYTYMAFMQNSLKKLGP